LKNYIFILIISLTALSCKKNGHGQLSGKVYDKATNLPVQNAFVILLSNNAPLHPFKGTFITRFKVTFEDSVLTDSEGNYIMYFKKKIGHKYYLGVRHPNYIFEDKVYKEIHEKNFGHDFYIDHK